MAFPDAPGLVQPSRDPSARPLEQDRDVHPPDTYLRVVPDSRDLYVLLETEGDASPIVEARFGYLLLAGCQETGDQLVSPRAPNRDDQPYGLALVNPELPN